MSSRVAKEDGLKSLVLSLLRQPRFRSISRLRLSAMKPCTKTLQTRSRSLSATRPSLTPSVLLLTSDFLNLTGLKSKLYLKQTHAVFDAVLDSCKLASSKCEFNLLIYHKLLVIAYAFQFFFAEKIFDDRKNHFDRIEFRRVDSIEDQSDIQLVCSGSYISTSMTT